MFQLCIYEVRWAHSAAAQISLTSFCCLFIPIFVSIFILDDVSSSYWRRSTWHRKPLNKTVKWLNYSKLFKVQYANTKHKRITSLNPLFHRYYQSIWSILPHLRRARFNFGMKSAMCQVLQTVIGKKHENFCFKKKIVFITRIESSLANQIKETLKSEPIIAAQKLSEICVNFVSGLSPPAIFYWRFRCWFTWFKYLIF